VKRVIAVLYVALLAFAVGGLLICAIIHVITKAFEGDQDAFAFLVGSGVFLGFILLIVGLIWAIEIIDSR